ncbi:MAG TPA: MFS transporter [Halioglobus sp.]
MLKTGTRAPYRGWRVLAAAFLSAMIAAGCSIHLFGLFVVAVTQEFGISRAGANNGMIALMLGAAIWSPVVGPMLDRLAARLVMGIGGVLLGGGLVAISQSQSLPLITAIIVGPIALGVAATGTLASNTVVVRWFRQRRGRALGLLAISSSAGGFLIVPLTALLIEQFGWRNALLQLGLLAGSLVLAIVLLGIRDRPQGDEAGFDQEFGSGGSDGTAGAADASEGLWTFRELLGNRNFWLLTLAVGLLFGSDQALMTSQVPYFQDAGISLSASAMIVSCMTASAVGGKLIVGALADRVDLRLLFLGVAVAHVGLLLVYIIQPGYWLLLASVSVMGIAVGGVYPVWTTLIAWQFGAQSFGTVMGAMVILMKPIAMLALYFIGNVHDRTGSYEQGFMMFIIAVCVAATLMLALRRPEQGTHRCADSPGDVPGDPAQSG